MSKTRAELEKELQEERGRKDLKLVDVLTPYQGRRRILVYIESEPKPWQVIGEDSNWYFDSEEAARAWRSGKKKRRMKHGKR